METARWLLLIHHIPPKPDYLRVKVRRRLHQIGALALKNSVYVLPHTDETMEDFQWLQRLVVDDGGEATICTAGFVEGVTDGEIEQMFRAQSDGEYHEILESARAIDDPNDGDLRRLKRHFSQVTTRDFFGAPSASAADQAVREVEAQVTGQTEAAPSPLASSMAPRGATWVTRRGVYVDRIASAWLIRRFIDTKANFKFVPASGYTPERGEMRFDMFEGEFTHQGDLCTFEVLLARFVRDDAGLRAIAEIVHDIDCKDEKFGRVEAAGVSSLLRGITVARADDNARIEAGAALLDGLYASFSPPTT